MEDLFNEREWIKLVAFESQKKIIASIEKQYKETGKVSEKQEQLIKAIIDQCETFSNRRRNTYAMYH